MIKRIVLQVLQEIYGLLKHKMSGFILLVVIFYNALMLRDKLKGYKVIIVDIRAANFYPFIKPVVEKLLKEKKITIFFAYWIEIPKNI